MVDWQKRLGDNVRRLRLERELTQQAVADNAGIAVRYLSDIEGGKRNPSLVVLVGLATALKIEIARLFD